eukprot:13421532-Alexandrium_andersonii.AAC.1
MREGTDIGVSPEAWSVFLKRKINRLAAREFGEQCAWSKVESGVGAHAESGACQEFDFELAQTRTGHATAHSNS